MSIPYFPEERCVMCGELIEEGMQVCNRCKMQILDPQPKPIQPETPHPGKLHKILRCLFSFDN